MQRVSKKEMDDMQALIDGMKGEPESGRTPDSNTKAETVVSSAMDAWAVAEDEQKKKDRLKKL